ncbi:unnamed protein product [Cuscuta campestris]|uniref:25S rRNA (uridine-N(3))-methyltransferase BMT5-like domain-containing protein n=1 Tax=Cuscuta campestris TaxID=132261 RepID=A0A484MS28_9ASTE|nr:unnamed protein product [Cuscuta campestris]
MVFPRDFSDHAASQKTLLVGEADFSFAASLAAAFGSSASNLTATSLEYKRELEKVYSKAVDNIQELKSKGCNVFHAVDATVMASHPSFKNSVFDRIVFNFPFAVISEEEWGNLHNPAVLEKQHSLVRAFLENAKELISKNGEVHITHRTDGVYGAWRIKFLACEQGFQLVEAVDFDVCDYPGYNPKWGNGSDYDMESSPSKTYTFRLPCPPLKVVSFPPTEPSWDTLLDVLASLSTISNHAEKCEEFHYKSKKLPSPLVIPNFKHDDMSHDAVDNIVAEETRWIKHYSSSQKILLVGEGDFSFACSLASAFGSYASNLTATSLEYKRELKQVYVKAADNIEFLQSKGCNVWHAVDATVMASHPCLKNSVFDRIVFNFPFAVVSKEEWGNLHFPTVLKKQHSLVRDFLENAKKLINENGEIHITHRTDGVYGAWRIKFFASEQGFQLVEVVDFDVCDYPGYNPKWGNGSDDSLESFPSKTYKFRLPRPPLKVLSLSPTEQSRDHVIDASCSSNLAEKCEEIHNKPLNLPSPSLIPNFMRDEMRNDVVDDIIAEEIKWIKHYSSSQKILLVGEGDFSFACSLAAAFGSASNLTATSLEYKRELTKVYAKAADNILVLKSKGCNVWHAVDATAMASFPSLKNSVFDRIVFNFPFAVVSEEEWANLHLQTVLEKQHSLVREFLENAKKLISENGEIHITHRKDGIFGAWRIKFLASEQGFQLVQAVDFNICDYPGYNPKWGNGSDDNLNSFPSKTYKFKLPHSPLKPVQDVPIFPLINTYHAEQPNDIYEFINKNSNVSTEMLESVANHNLKQIGVEQETNMGVVEEEKWLKHYSSSHKMLLVGEGDFSFSASLAAAFGSAVNMVATSLDSKTTSRKVYTKALNNIKALNAKGCKVLHSVDATTMASHPCLKGSVFDRIIFNFPLAVVPKHCSYPQIRKHQDLVKKFFKNSKQMIDYNGEIHVTHRTDGGFGAWRIKFLASKQGLEFMKATDFNISDYPGYNATWEIESDDDLKCVHSKTYKFRLPQRLIKTPSYSPTEPSYISLEDVSMIQLTSNTILAEQSEEFDYGFTQNSSNTDDELISPSWWEAAFISPLSKYHTEYHLNQKHMWEDNVNALVEEEKMVKHYSISQKILLVGEGDFSFSVSLAAAFGSSSNMTATSLDSRTVLEKQYEKAVYHIEELKRSGCKVMHDVDATNMSSHPHLKGSTFDRIVFNFPYACVSEHDSRESRLCAHQSLVRAFLENAKKMIGQNGEIHITHRTDGEYGAWRIKFIASQQGLEFVESVHFSAADYPGYTVKFHEFKSTTYKFRLLRRLLKTVSPSYSPTEPSNISLEDVSMVQLTDNTNLSEQSEEFDYGFTRKWPNTDEELISISLSRSSYDLRQSNMCEDNINGIVGEEKWLKHYSSSHKMLLVGEGDFSFSTSLAAAFGSAVNMVATSLDSKTTLRKVYPKSIQNIKSLKAKGCKVLHSVDVTTMASHPSLKGSVFDRIVFNFPLAVVPKQCTYPPIRKHQSLVKKFLENSKQMIDNNGEIHVTHRTDGGFGSWRIKLLASKQGLEFVEAKKFTINDYPGYNATWEIGSDDDLKCVHSKTYKFRLPRQILKTVSPSYSPTEPSNISLEDVSMIQLPNQTNLAGQSEEFFSGFNVHQEPVFPIPVPNQTEIGYNLFQNEMFYPMMSPYGDSLCAASQNQNGFYPSSIYLGDNQSKKQEKWIKHYSSGHKILLVGEGDFSFSACLAAAFGSAANMTATSLDSEEFLTTNYCKAFLHLRELKRRGCKVMHGIDATYMIYDPSLAGSTFDRIIFNFPYAGFFKAVPRPSQLSCHQALVRLFLSNAKRMLRENGEIHITHKTNGFHREWGIGLIGLQEGLELAAAVDFDVADYAGYSNKYGFGGDNHFDPSPSQTYMFRLPRTAAATPLQCHAYNTWFSC